MLVKFPDLKKYDKAWPVTDLLKGHLKYSSTASRKKSAEIKAAAVDELIARPGNTKGKEFL